MANKPDRGFIDWWTEYAGRQQPFTPPVFPDSDVVVGPMKFEVNILGKYFLPSHPTVSAIIVAPNGKRTWSEGGLIQREPGQYHVYYVDRRERVQRRSAELESADGFKVGITASIAYHVNDPVTVLNVQRPLDALFAGFDAAIKNIIQTHRHDELIGDPDSGQRIGDNEIAARISEQISLNQACRAFSLINVTILSRQSDPKAINLREQRQIQERKSVVEKEGVIQKQGIASQENILDIIRARGSASVRMIATKFQAREYMTLAEVNRLKIEFEMLRNDPRFQQERYLKEIEKQTKALEALVNAQTRPGALNNELGIKIVETLSQPPRIETPNAHKENLPESNPPKAQKLIENHDDDEYIQLLIPKKKKK